MRKHTLPIICGILSLSCIGVMLAGNTQDTSENRFEYTIRNAEITRSLESKNFYEQNDILIKVYEFECEDGVGGVTFDVNYDGDNLDFYDVSANSSYNTVYRDNHVGKLTVGTASKNVEETADINKIVKIAVGFKTLYMLDSNYISFSYSVKDFVSGNIKKSDDYNMSESFYVYDYDACDVEYEEYVRNIIGIDLNDTDTDSDTDSDTDTQSEKYICGDIDSDGKITSADALSVLRNSVELEYFTPVQIRLGDVDGDGEITSADSLEILRYSVGIPSSVETGKTILIF